MIYAITFLFMIMDIFTGITKGLKEKNFNSSIMREGLFHKFGSIAIIVLGLLVDYAQSYMDIGMTIPIGSSMCVYVVLMEISSIIENICKINPEIVPSKIKCYFSKIESGDDNGEK